MWVKGIISGETRGSRAACLRLLLRIASGVYGVLIYVRNRLYDKGILKSIALELPVICVGNITAGGTGKTPMVIWVCRYLLEQGKKVVVLSRGYKGQSEDGNEEVLMLRRSVPEVPVVVDPDRVRGGRKAMVKYKPDVIVLDDGFQHRRLGRGLDIVMIDGMCPFGYEHLLPWGLLREPLKELRRAGVFVLSRCDQISDEHGDEIAARLLREGSDRGLARDKCIIRGRHEPKGLYNAAEKEVPLEELSGRKVAVFCGIGNPESFLATIKQLGAEVAGREYLPDHVTYNNNDPGRLAKWGRDCGADWLVTTQKDWVKLRAIPGTKGLDNLYWLQVEMTFGQDREQLQREIDQAINIKAGSEPKKL